MAHKEMASYEAAAGQPKPPPFQLPSMASSESQKSKKQLAEENNESKSNISNNNINSQPVGHYLNVAHKGKLILPMALWVLLIIAGVCFLTLLASLNRSLNAIDELVELEEAKVSKLEAIDRVQKHLLRHEHELHRRHRHHDQKKPPASHQSFQPGSDADRLTLDLQFSDSSPAEAKAGLFDMPFGILSSLGGLSGQSSRLVGPPRPFGRRPAFLEQPDVSSTIVISSSMTPTDESDLSEKRDSSLVSSIMREFMPVLGSPFNGPAKESRAQEPRKEPLQSGPLISAKIGKINVNINTRDDNHREPKKDHKESSHLDTSSLEGSINGLVGKMLLDDKRDEPHFEPSFVSRPRPPPFGPLSGLLGSPFAGPLGSPIISGLPSSSFVIEPIGPSRAPGEFPLRHPHHHHPHPHHHHRHDKMLPIIMALDGPGGEPSAPRPMSGMLPGEDIVMDARPMASGELFRHGLSNTRRPSFGQSPYEFSPLSEGGPQADDMSQLLSSLKQLASESGSQPETSKPPTGGPWKMLADDIGPSLVQSLMFPDQGAPTSKSEPSSSILVMDADKPEGEQKLSTLFPPVHMISNDRDNNKSASSLFELMFGPPLASSLVVAQPEMASPVQQTGSPVEAKIQPIEPTSGPAASDNNQPAELPNLTPALQSTVAPSTLEQSTLRSNGDPEEFTKDLASVVSSLFALPQTSGQSNPMRVVGEGGSGGSQSSGGESSTGPGPKEQEMSELFFQPGIFLQPSDGPSVESPDAWPASYIPHPHFV